MMPRATLFGFNPPFFGGPQNILSRQEDVRLIKNDLLQLLLTIPGERVMRPSFGTPLRSFVFEQLSDYDLTSLEGAVQRSVEQQDPRVTVTSLKIVRDDERNGISLRLVASLVRDPAQQIPVEQFLAMRV